MDASEQDDPAAAWNEIAESYGAAPIFSRLAETLVELAAITTGESVLDLGTGNGLCLLPAARASGDGRVVGVDFSPSMLEVAGRRLAAAGLSDVELECMDASALTFADETFEVALASSVWQFVGYEVSVLAEWRRVLRRGGRLAFSVPGPASTAGIPLDLIGKYFKLLPASTQQRILGARRPRPMPDLSDAATQAGFATSDVSVRRWADSIPDPDAWWAAQWTHGIRGLLRELDGSSVEELRHEAIARLDRSPSGEIQVTTEFVFCVAHT